MMKYAPVMLVISALATLLPHAFPSGGPGIGFDDVGFAKTIRKVMVPGGNTGKLGLIDPNSQKMEIIGGLSQSTAYTSGHGEGITSSDASGTLVYVTDRSTKMLDVVDLHIRRIMARTPLAAEPDYVRYVPETNQVWVTEPGRQRIEIFSLSHNRIPTPTHSGSISVSGGPESLVIGRKLAFTNLWRGTTLALDVTTHRVVGRWLNGCKRSRGVALDESRGFLFAGCDEGKLSVLDIKTGRLLGEVSAGAGVDIIAYNQRCGHVYMPGADSGTMAVLKISANGVPAVLATADTVKGAHCVTADDRDHVYICDPRHGKILVFKDVLPSSE